MRMLLTAELRPSLCPAQVYLNLYLGDPNSTASGTVQMSTGSFSASYNEYLGNKGTGVFTQTGGTNNINSSNGQFYLGNNPGSSGVYNLSGAGVLSAVTECVGCGGAGTLNQSGGTNNLGNGNNKDFTSAPLMVPVASTTSAVREFSPHALNTWAGSLASLAPLINPAERIAFGAGKVCSTLATRVPVARITLAARECSPHPMSTWMELSNNRVD